MFVVGTLTCVYFVELPELLDDPLLAGWITTAEAKNESKYAVIADNSALER